MEWHSEGGKRFMEWHSEGGNRDVQNNSWRVGSGL